MQRVRVRLVLLAALLVQWVLAATVPAQDRASAEPLPTVGGNGGTSFTRQCPPGYVLTGLRARTSSAIDAVGIRCRPIGANGDLGTERDVGSLAGGTGGTPSSGSCPEGTVVSGQAAGSNERYVNAFVLRCRRWEPDARRFVGGVVGTVRVSSSAVPSVVVNSPVAAGLRPADCPRPSQPAVLLRGRSSTVIDAVGLTCNEP